ncbi:DUF4268 domain-containing protein [Maribacter algicola]|uniref:DUF4268 domain-containing protein n=1 Tax=Maribacter algicola TaxID=2498892 RepID=A0A426RIX5_9FLAO|nr:DUF4268 domain-containing protein [Maribacter algicola]RRQ48965.1 DUF4268 domain-containing protein [Maribacter algicola]
MFSKEESRKLREEFWISFGKSYPKKWVLYKTKIKGLSFKFTFDLKKAMVSIDVEGDLEQRILVWEKLISLKSILLEDYWPEAIFEEYHLLENQKEISRIYTELNEVSIHNKNTWLQTMVFLSQNMDKIEVFYEDFKDILKP